MPRNLIAVLAAASLVAAGCGGGGSDAPTTTTSEAITTTTSPPPPALLTGLPLEDSDKQKRPALSIKIDNAPKARPQAGLDAADVIYEEVVEGGAVRFLAVFQSRDTELLGPVRSVRPVDADIVAPLGGLFGYSGGAAPFVAMVRRTAVKMVGWRDVQSAYTQRKGRPGPHNLFTSTTRLYEEAEDDMQGPPPLFTFLPTGEPFGLTGGAPVTYAHVQMGGQARTEWTWDPAAGVWRRATQGTPHTLENGQQLGMTNVVVQFVQYRNTTGRDAAGNLVPTADVVGSGDVWVLSGGRVLKGRWAKPSPTAVTQFTDTAGLPIKLTPGTTWVSLAPVGAATTLR